MYDLHIIYHTQITLVACQANIQGSGEHTWRALYDDPIDSGRFTG